MLFKFFTIFTVGVNLNEEWLDKYQKNLKDLNQLIKNDDQIEILKVNFKNYKINF
jgi:mevalonate pyrophosphate decarboxylase